MPCLIQLYLAMEQLFNYYFTVPFHKTNIILKRVFSGVCVSELLVEIFSKNTYVWFQTPIDEGIEEGTEGYLYFSNH